jgi:hypothetical protein
MWPVSVGYLDTYVLSSVGRAVWWPKIEACDGPAPVTMRTAAQSVGVAFIR